MDIAAAHNADSSQRALSEFVTKAAPLAAVVNQVAITVTRAIKR